MVDDSGWYPWKCFLDRDHLWAPTGSIRKIWSAGDTTGAPPEGAILEAEMRCVTCGAKRWDVKKWSVKVSKGVTK